MCSHLLLQHRKRAQKFKRNELLPADSDRIPSEIRPNQWNALSASLSCSCMCSFVESICRKQSKAMRYGKGMLSCLCSTQWRELVSETCCEISKRNNEQSCAIYSNEVVVLYRAISFFFFYFHSFSPFEMNDCVRMLYAPTQSISVVHLAIRQQSSLFIQQRLANVYKCHEYTSSSR